MKPKEFDELVRQKFDRNDFEYNSRNWDRLADQLDGRAKKRSIIMWWWMPVMGVAASVALAIGIPALWQQQNAGNTGANVALVQKNTPAQSMQQQDQPVQLATIAAPVAHYAKVVAKNKKHTPLSIPAKNTTEVVAIQFHDVANDHVAIAAAPFNFMAVGDALPVKEDKKKVAVTNPGYNTFKPEEEIKKEPKTSIIISGGINRGSQNSGYMAGITIRRMLNDKVFIESDVAFANSDNTQSTSTIVSVPAAAARSSNHTMAAKSSDAESNKTTVIGEPTEVVKQEDVSYNLSYAQITPSIGYKIMKRMSLAVGPDFQQMLVDNRPVQSALADRNNIQEAPSFDIGLIGKSEFAVTKKIKAGVYYRKGVNSFINLTDKYIDRDYLQFQVKCTIFNK